MQLPFANERNIRIFYILNVTNSAAFVAGNFIFFWLRYMSYTELGFLDAVSFAFGLAMEIPTGVVGDSIGRRRALLLAGFFSAVGGYIMAAADSFWVLAGGFMVLQLGFAFFSGTAEAMAYDTLKAIGREAAYDTVISTATSIRMMTLAITTLAGGLMWIIHYRLPHYGLAVAFMLGWFASYWIQDLSMADVEKLGARQQFRAGMRQAFRPELRHFTPLIITLLSVSVIYDFGVVTPAIAIEFGFFADEQAIIFTLRTLLSAFIISQIPRLRRVFNDTQGLVVLMVILIVALFGAALPLGFFGITVLFLLRFVETLSQPWASIIINPRIPSQSRATALSTFALLARIPYVMTAVALGIMVEAGLLWLFNLAIGTVVLLILVIWWWRAPVLTSFNDT